MSTCPLSHATLRSESEPMARINRAIEPLLDGQPIYYMGSPGTTNISSFRELFRFQSKNKCPIRKA